MDITTITINAFGYEHDFSDAWVAGDIEMIQDAPYLYLICGVDEAVARIESGLPMDSVMLWSDAGEALVFGYEPFAVEAYAMIETLNLRWEMEDRGE
jgi:hypothetical protein